MMLFEAVRPLPCLPAQHGTDHQQNNQGMDQLNMAGEAVKQVPEHGVMVSAANRGQYDSEDSCEMSLESCFGRIPDS